MMIAGLTGSIAMGKSTVASLFKQHGIPIISADDLVHQLYQGRAVPLIEAAFPGTSEPLIKSSISQSEHRSTGQKAGDKIINRQKLMAALKANPDGLKQLEKMIHPLVREEEWAFISAEKINNSPLVIIEIPLLFETGADVMMDAVIVVSAPPDIQKQRAFERPNMDEDKFKALLANQMPDTEKRSKADYIINTGLSLQQTEDEVKTLIETLKSAPTRGAYETWKTQFSKTS